VNDYYAEFLGGPYASSEVPGVGDDHGRAPALIVHDDYGFFKDLPCIVVCPSSAQHLQTVEPGYIQGSSECTGLGKLPLGEDWWKSVGISGLTVRPLHSSSDRLIGWPGDDLGCVEAST